jgi:hypothetical protein
MFHWPASSYISVTGPTRCTVCFQFIMINGLYMFRALIFSSSGGTEYTEICIFCTYYVAWLLVADITRTKYANCCICISSWWLANMCSKHVQAINHNKLRPDTASCWCYYTTNGRFLDYWTYTYIHTYIHLIHSFICVQPTCKKQLFCIILGQKTTTSS